mmetsp:Transcript_21900/g.48109  ORF Transcript_21900/g.48109 Transcript_21900/m.48109 type:complete len:213 (-) Transcript_21900:2-640(-)
MSCYCGMEPLNGVQRALLRRASGWDRPSTADALAMGCTWRKISQRVWPIATGVPTGTDMSCCAERFVATCTIRSPTAWIASSPRMHTRSWRTLKEIVRGSSLSLTRAMCTLNTLLSSSSKDNSSIWLVVPNNSCSSPMIWAEAHLTSTISCSWHGWSNHQPVINIFCIFGHRVSRNVVAVAPIFKSGVPRVKLVDAVGGWDSEWNAAWIWRG